MSLRNPLAEPSSDEDEGRDDKVRNPFSNKPTRANRKSKSLMDRLQISGMLVVYRVVANVFAKARECQPIVSPLDEAEYLIRR